MSEISENDLKLITPFTMILSGGTHTGKTTFIFKLIKNISIFSPPVNKILYIYSEYQKCFDDFKDKIFFTKDIKFLDIEPNEGERLFIIIDDMMDSIGNNQNLLDLFTKKSHHQKICVCVILQNIFKEGKIFKDLRCNTMYFALSNHMNNFQKIEIFARQLEGKNSNYFISSYEDCMKTPFNIFFIDLHPKSKINHLVKYRSGVENIDNQVIYLRK